MPESFNFTWELFDKVSHAAEAIQRSLEKAEHAMTHAEKAAHHGWREWQVMGLKMGVVAGVAQGLTTALMRLGGEGIELAASGVKWALEAGSFNENAMLSLEALLGTKKAAHEAMGEWRELAEGTPFETRQIIEWGKQLRIAGETAENTKTVLKGIADIGTAMGNTPEQQAAASGAALQAIVNMRQMGFVSERALRSFRALGISPAKIEQNMANRLTGGNIWGLRALLETQMVQPAEGELAILQAIQDQFGKLGALSGKGANTLSGLLGKVMDRPFDLFKGLESTPGYTALKGVLRNLNEILNPSTASGKALMSGLRELSTGLGEFLKPLTGPDGKTNMIEFFRSMKQGIEDLLPGLRAMVQAGGFLAKWGLLKPLQGIGMIADIAHDVAQIVGGGNPETATGKAFLQAAYGDSADYRSPTFQGVSTWGKGGLSWNALSRGGASINVQNTFHVHGSTDTDALAGKMHDLQQESFTAMVERLSLFGAGG